jgi:hypothetical protein
MHAYQALSERASSAPLTAEQKEALLRRLAVPAQLSAEQRDSLPMLEHQVLDLVAAPAIDGLSRALQFAAPLLLFIMTVVYGLPIIVLGLTVMWFVARRRYPPTPTASAA